MIKHIKHKKQTTEKNTTQYEYIILIATDEGLVWTNVDFHRGEPCWVDIII